MAQTRNDKFILEFANYIHPNLEIRMTQEKGRGVFATKRIKQGEMIFAEKPIVSSSLFCFDAYLLDVPESES